ncbi:AraC family transcriptional regulator [Nocardia sp. AG03]|uniref:helix-turn-helix transcriptional regulator n=1 Tax=Nocardia sp. AG03 TaxID=3025312 RepID=UPI00241849E8|nr:AraC family transcriptional regulator [Nocardia sp. AG03]
MTGEWIGDWRLGPGRLAMIGRFGSTHPHRHPAVQVTVALTGEFVASDDSESRTCRAVLIPSGVRHALAPADDATRVLSIYLHPASVDARRSAALVGERTGPAAWSTAADAALGAELDEDLSLDAMTDAVLAALRGRTPAPDTVPPKLRNAFELLGAALPRTLSLRDLATAVALSQSSLSRLFAAETGASFPATVRWARLLHAMGEVGAGRNITEAAHAAGFTDSAHATRVCREMTGVAPGVLVRATRRPVDAATRSSKAR